MVLCFNRIRNTAGTAASRSGFLVCSSECANGGKVVLKPDWYQSRGATVQALELRENSAFCGCVYTSHQEVLLTHRKFHISSRPAKGGAKLLYSRAPNGILLSSGLFGARGLQDAVHNLVDPASSHMLVSKIKPCMSQYKLTYCKTANGSLKQLLFT